MMTIKEIKIKFFNTLPDNELDSIISYIIRKDKVYVLTYPEHILNLNDIKKIKIFVKKRLNNFPLAYLLGYKEFYGNKFIVNKNVLVPRPESELMVERAKNLLNNSKHDKIIDIGTGSGCIIISLARETSQNVDMYGVDISTKALTVARKNAKINKVDNRIKFKKSDLLSKIILPAKINCKVVITANLPYLTSTQIKNSPTIKREPRLALIGGKDGLKYYKKLFKQINKVISKNRLIEFTLMCEIDPSQNNAIRNLAKKIFLDNFSIEIIKDLRNHSRLAVLYINNLK